ncbi:aldehyde-activating protein [Phenylobacterium sp.]|uniref:GFA family protein n=1 Tax=Phenylobacterium sp. TaxID=1871053 RepID=UPI002ED7DF80
MTQVLTGHCHCGAIRVELAPGRPVAELPVRACQCGFCRRHGARTTSDPMSRLNIEAAPGSLNRYRFGRRAVDALLCEECGVYVASMLEADGALLATLNVAGVDLDGFEDRTAEPVTYDDESDEERLARRKARWTPAVLVETLPSA